MKNEKLPFALEFNRSRSKLQIKSL